MHIAIDLTGLLPSPTGVDRFMMQIVRNLARIDLKNRYTIFLNYGNRRLFAGQLPSNFVTRALSLQPRALRALFQQVVLPAAARASRIDVLHSPAFLLPLRSTAPRHLLTVHDMTFFQMPEVHDRLRRSPPFLWAVLQSIRKADMIHVPSEATRTALLELMREPEPERVRVVRYGIDDQFRPDDPQECASARDRLGLRFPYILYLGTLEPRKNLCLLVESYRRLIAGNGCPEHLVLAGKSGWGNQELERNLEAPELKGRVHRLGYIPSEDLGSLYRGARLFVYPSRCEGFGFPPLEAMACGTPVIAADNSSLSENLAGAAEMVPNGDAVALSAAMRTLLGSPELCARRRELGLARAATFRWERTAAETLASYQELARGRHPSLRNHQGTVAGTGDKPNHRAGRTADRQHEDHRCADC